MTQEIVNLYETRCKVSMNAYKCSMNSHNAWNQASMHNSTVLLSHLQLIT